MMKYPLFGQDSVPHYTSSFFAILGTVIFWIIFLVVLIFVKPAEKEPKFKTVQIVLSSTPVTTPAQKKTEAFDANKQPEQKEIKSEEIPQNIQNKNPEVSKLPEAIEEISAVKTIVPVEQKEPVVAEVPVNKPKIEKKEISKKTDSQPAKKVEPVTPAPEPVYAKSVEELMEEQWNSKTSAKADSVWDSFEEETDVVKTQQTTSQKVVPIENSFSGSAGTTEVAQKLKSETVTNKDFNQTAQKSTNSALSEIENAKANGISEVSNENTKTSAKESNNSDFTWKNGVVRKLIMPSHPEIKISKENQSKINFSEVEITFTVSADGYVSKASVTTNPAIPQSVLNEIAEQIIEWWFEPGAESATAVFRLSIKQKY